MTRSNNKHTKKDNTLTQLGTNLSSLTSSKLSTSIKAEGEEESEEEKKVRETTKESNKDGNEKKNEDCKEDKEDKACEDDRERDKATFNLRKNINDAIDKYLKEQVCCDKKRGKSETKKPDTDDKIKVGNDEKEESK